MASLPRFVAAVVPVGLMMVLSWYGVFTFVNAYMIKGLGCSNAQWTAATLWLAGGIIVWQLLLGDVAAVIGRRETIALALAAAGIGYAVIPMVPRPFFIGPVLALMSLTQAAGAVVWTPLVAEVGRDRPGRAMAIGTLVATVIQVGALIGGRLLIDKLSYRTAFTSFSVVGIACALAFWFLSASFQSACVSEVVPLRKLTRSDLAKLVGGPFLMVALVGVALEPFNYHSMNQLFPNIARDVHQFSEPLIVKVVAYGRLPSLIGLLVFAHWIDRLHAARWYGLALVLAGLSVVGVGLAPSGGRLIGSYLFFYMFQGVIWTANLAAVNAAVQPRQRDAAFTVVCVIATVGVLIAGAFQNALVRSGFTLPRIFMACGAIAVLAGAVMCVYFQLRESRRVLPAAAAAG